MLKPQAQGRADPPWTLRSEGPDLICVVGGARPGLHLGAVGSATVGQIEALRCTDHD